MASSQSQEALASIDLELKTILKRKENDEEDSDTDTEIYDDSKKSEEKSPKKRQKLVLSASSQEIVEQAELITSRKKRMAADSEEAPATQKSPRKSLNIVTLNEESLGTRETATPRHGMERSKSIESISKYPPAKIIRVCIEKTNLLITETNDDLPHRDYKKIKYWLKIAQNVCSSVNRTQDFLDYLKVLRTSHSDKDSALKDLLNENFPEETTQ